MVNLLDRLANKFTIGDGCWEWTAAKIPGGYGSIAMPGGQTGAHRVLYELMVGPIPAGLHIDHLCRNRGCVRPDHLEPVTPAENSRRAFHPGNGMQFRTECANGHPYSADPAIDSRGARRCRSCTAERGRRYRARKREAE